MVLHRKFMALRVGRIYPLHLAMLALFIIFEIAFASGLMGHADRQPFTRPNDLSIFVANLLLLQTFVGPDWTSWNGPSWSIAVEVWTYLIYSFVFRFGRSMTITIALSLSVACCAYLPALSDHFINVSHDGALARCLHGFSLGTICYEIHRTGLVLQKSYLAASVTEIAIATLVVAAVSLAGAGPLSLSIPVVFSAAVLIYSNEAGIVSRILKQPFFLFLGLLSYSIYMVHYFLVLRFVNGLELFARISHGKIALVVHSPAGNHIGGSPIFGDCMSLAVLVTTICVARLTYRWIEKPAQDWSRRKLLGLRPSMSAQVAEINAPAL
jgi:peptidoglycan/LPS O-acetylase OafA/YrhL